MNNIEKIYRKSKNIGEFAAGYFGYLKNVLKTAENNYTKNIIIFDSDINRNIIFSYMKN